MPLCLLWFALSTPLYSQTKKPNIIFLMADDLSPMWFSAYGEKNDVKTPHFDRMVKEGVGFANAWCTPMCSPTRALVVTGQYGTRTGWLHNNLKVPIKGSDFMKNGIAPFFRQLKKSGYRTAFCGRWGIPADWSIAVKDFDSHCLHVGSPNQIPKDYHQGDVYDKDDLMFVDVSLKASEASSMTIQVESRQGYFNQPFYSRYWNPSILLNGRMLETQKDDFSSDIFSDFILDFAKEDPTEPFLVYYPMFLTHGIADMKAKNKLPRPPHVGQPGQITGGSMKECAEYLDIILGKIMKGLEASGLADNTILVFNSDNGDCVYGKTKATAKGARVPYAVWSPKLVKKRGMVKQLTEFSDLYPTFLELSGAPSPDHVLDGQSIAPFLLGKSDATRDTILSYIGTAKMARNGGWVLEAVDPMSGEPDGRLYKTNGAMDPAHFQQVSVADYPEIHGELMSAIHKMAKVDWNGKDGKDALEKYNKAPAGQRHRLK